MKGAPLPPIGLTHTALVLHDMQNDFIKVSLSKPEMVEVVKRTRALIDLARSLPIPVIYTLTENDPDMTSPQSGQRSGNFFGFIFSSTTCNGALPNQPKKSALGNGRPCG